MNWRRGLFRLWIVSSALFVLTVAFVSYPSIKAEFIVAANKSEASFSAALCTGHARRERIPPEHIALQERRALENGASRQTVVKSIVHRCE